MFYQIFQLLIAFYLFDVNLLRCEAKKVSPFLHLGQNLRRNEFPFVGVILIYTNDQFTDSFTCTGTLITKNLVLTAGHCLEQSDSCEMVQPNWISFHIGNVRMRHLENADHHRVVEQIFRHKNYICSKEDIPEENWYDISVMKLTHPIDLPVAVLFETSNLARLTRCVAIGAGENRTGWLQDRIQKAKMPVRRIEPLRERFDGFVNYNPIYQVVAKEANCVDGQCPDFCTGDSGGPLMCPYQYKPSVFGLLAISSTSYEPCGDQEPSTFVKVAPFRRWLNRISWAHSVGQLFWYTNNTRRP